MSPVKLVAVTHKELTHYSPRPKGGGKYVNCGARRSLCSGISSDWQQVDCPECLKDMPRCADREEEHCYHSLRKNHKWFPGNVCCWCGDLFEPLNDSLEHGEYVP